MKQVNIEIKKCQSCEKESQCFVEVEDSENFLYESEPKCVVCYKAEKLQDSFEVGAYNLDDVRIRNVAKAVKKLSEDELFQFLKGIGSRIEF